MVSKRPDIEPIIPMGLLIQRLGCKIDWGEGGVFLHHPKRGTLPIQLNGGCPQLSRPLTLDLIEELEKTVVLGKIEERSFKEEVEWMRKLVEVHPVLRKLPEHIKTKLAVQPGSWSELPANRRTRKRLQRDGFIAICLPEKTQASHWLERGINKVGIAIHSWRLTSKEAQTTTFCKMWGRTRL